MTGFCLQTVGGDHITLCSILIRVVVMVKCNGLGNVTVPACSWLTVFFCMAA